MQIGIKTKSILALCGVAVLAITYGAVLIPFTFINDKAGSHALEGGASRVGDVRTTGSASSVLHPQDNRRTTFVEEVWKWKMPETLREGDDGVLEISCSSQTNSMRGPAGDFLSQFSSKPQNGNTDAHVSVSGDVKWHTETESKEPIDCGKTAELSWPFTAINRGNKIIQVKLPPSDGFFGFRKVANMDDRMIENQSVKVFADSIELRLRVRGPFGLSKDAELIFKLLGSLIGFVLAYPLIIDLIKRRFEVAK